MDINTSTSHPLRIDALAIPGAAGLIGLSFCPGKCQCHALSGHWQRDLDRDLQAVAAWGANAVVNLMEDHEMHALGVADTRARMPAGIEYIRLPIPDMGIPDVRWEREWRETGAALRSTLLRGGRVFVHCKGGLGRTGVVAARLLVEFGVAPAQAVSLVRQARPGTIETAQQVDYVMRQRH